MLINDNKYDYFEGIRLDDNGHYDNLDTALVAYHTELAYRNESRTSTDCAILNADLQVMYRESYKATAPAPSPEPEEDGGEDTPVEGE